ncbi:MAG TPA: DUF58 domain-containing protein [Mycobacteriales bacterium]|nr:DUF58 domain-containing protein [Mycobacteriales bacterium]
MTEDAAPAADVPRAQPTLARVSTGSRGSGVLVAIERGTGVTPSGLAVIGIAAAMLALSRVLSSRGMALLAYGLLMALGLSWTLGRRKLAIDAERSELPTRVPAKRTIDAELTLRARRRASGLIVEENLDEQLGQPVRVAVPILPAGRDITHAYQFVPQYRGVYHVGPLVAEYSDPFGLTKRRQEICGKTKIIVHPRLEPVIDRISSREFEDPPMRPPVSRPWPTGFEFYGMRDYVDGDDPRRIVWRALAQYDKYLVREAEQGITDRVNIYLDSDRDNHTAGHPSESFECAVNIAASLGARHLADGFSVCLDVNSGRLAKNFRGSGKRIPLLDELSAVKPENVELQGALDRLFSDPQRNAHNILITPHLTQASAARLRLLLQRGGSLILVLVITDDTDPMTLHRAGSLRCNVVEAGPQVPLQAVFQHVISATRL